MCQKDYDANGGKLVATTELFINRVDNSALGERGFVPFGEIVKGFNGAYLLYMAARRSRDPLSRDGREKRVRHVSCGWLREF